MNELLRRILFLPPQASSMARDVDALHFLVIGVTMFSSFFVAAVAWAFIVRHRRRLHADVTARLTAPATVEVPLIAGTLTLFIVFWVIGYGQYCRMQAPPKGAMEVYVMAKQWMWKFSYPDGPSATEQLTVPAGRPVRLLMTSRDVIHSFYVPALRLKQDVIPGRYVSTWFLADRPGRYPIYCAEYCGVSHSRMLGEVVVLPQAAYEEWLGGSERQRVAARDVGAPKDEGEGARLAVIGRAVAARRACFACHTIDGQRHVGPTWRGLYMSEVPLEGGGAVTADEAYLTRLMMEPRADVVLGFQPVMPSFHGVISEPETAALVEYIKTLRDPGPPSGVTLPKVETRAP